MTDKEVQQLIKKYLDGKAGPEEKGMLESWYVQNAQKNTDIDYPKNLLAKKENGLQEILAMEQLKSVPVVKHWKWLRFTAAAAMIIGLSTLLYLTVYDTPQTDASIAQANDIAPGKNTATLTLANGKKILLSNALNGELAKESGVVITKMADGQLVYEIKDQQTGPADQMNTLSTANGEQYRLLLPDGTSVWLNAASSLKFPSTFSGLAQRRVELDGEGYFEVKKDKEHAFVVVSKEQEVEVLGTHFNVNAYNDESNIKTTLLEGSVKINKDIILKPGEQSSLLKSGSILLKQVDVEEAVSWKEGYFRFDQKDLRSIMRNISRWYDLEVVYKDSRLENLTFSGTVSRYSSVSKILEILELSKEVRFTLEGRRIIVTK
ncbi:FecR family protein [Pedobacter caeni]|uniref:FecR family protein n=1 Tax=Pedobacter caeni TaxID=288992 RepID=A0A1M5BLC2_9SPHI|nr:FecR domain-containing protein [Pedobacter caeni]SHF43279.1 FecR family protein [Pedobacter caeni]